MVAKNTIIGLEIARIHLYLREVSLLRTPLTLTLADLICEQAHHLVAGCRTSGAL